jgi:hypothetical protein
MSNDPGPFPPIFSINVSADASTSSANSNQTPPPASALPATRNADVGTALIALTRQLVDAQNRQNQMLDQLLQVNRQVLQLSLIHI